MNRISKSHETEPNKCPHCDALLDRSVGVNEPDQRAPRPGDRSICIHCGNPCKFDDDMKLVKLTDEEMKQAMADPYISKMLEMVKQTMVAAQELGDTICQSRYTDQLELMAQAVKEWRKTNHGLSPSIQYNFQKDVCIIASMREAIEHNMVSINDDARTMLTQLGWLENKLTEPTVLMVRVVLEHAFEEEE